MNSARSSTRPLCTSSRSVFPNCLPVSLAVLRPAGDDQPIIVTPGQDLPKCGDQVFEPLVGRDLPKNRIVFSPSRIPSRRFASLGVRRVFGTALLIPNGMTVTRFSCDAKLLDEFTLHLFRVNEDMVGKPILDSERQPIEERIVGVPPAGIHIVHGAGRSSSPSLVVKHQQRSIEELEFVVPQDMKDSRPGRRGVANQPGSSTSRP